MAEETIWRGSPSQWKNAGHFLACAIFALVVVCAFFFSTAYLPQMVPFNYLVLLLLLLPLGSAVKRFLQTSSVVYELTSERLKTSGGILSKVTETLELYRVKDIETRQPFLLRLVGLEDVHLQTSDASSPIVLISAVPSKVSLADKTRNQVEVIRGQKRVREIDIE